MLNTQNTQNCVEVADIEDISLDYIDPQEYSAEQYLQLCWNAVKQNICHKYQAQIQQILNNNNFTKSQQYPTF